MVVSEGPIWRLLGFIRKNMTVSLEPFWLTFEDGLRSYISKNAPKISFTSPLYTIDQKAENHYDVTITITNLGTQRFEIKLVENEFMVRVKMVDTPNEF